MPTSRTRPRNQRSRPSTSARPSNRGGAGRPGPQPPAPARRGRLRWGVAAAAVVAAAVALVLIVVQPWQEDGVSGAAGSGAAGGGGIEADPARVAELEAEEAERNAENLTAAGELAVSAQERLLPVMDGLHEASQQPTAAELGEWRDVVQDVADDVEALPPGSSQHNIVRNGLILSTGLLGDSLDVLELAGAAEGDGQTERLHGVADDLRSRAVDAWAMAAVELDLQYIEADRGHLHAFLPPHSGMSGEGEAEVPHGDH